MIIQDVLVNHLNFLVKPQEGTVGNVQWASPSAWGKFTAPMPHLLPVYTGFFSIMLQGVVKHCGHFAHIFTGWTCSAHDARIFCNVTLPQMVEDGCYTPGTLSIEAGGVVVLLVVVLKIWSQVFSSLQMTMKYVIFLMVQFSPWL